MVSSAIAVVLTLLCTLLVTQAWSVGAAPGDTDSTFVPTAGCRLVDTRPAPTAIGSRGTPLTAGDIYEVTVRGSNGNCTGALAIPADAVGVALNVTAVNATERSNIRVYPANLTTVPLLSNLNVTAGAPATPNKVDVQLSPDGKIKIYNFNGSVNVFVDVLGYYTDSSLKELESRVAELESVTKQLDASRAYVWTNRADQEEVTNARVVLSVTVNPQADGNVTVISTASVLEFNDPGKLVRCSITTGSVQDLDYLQDWKASPPNGSDAQLSGVRVFDVEEGVSQTYNLVCQGQDTEIGDIVLAAIYTPGPPIL